MYKAQNANIKGSYLIKLTISVPMISVQANDHMVMCFYYILETSSANKEGATNKGDLDKDG